jgi:GTP-binding protein
MTEIVKTAKFVMSNSTHTNCPQDDRAEFAFIGRSNVGKSSLINMLTNNKKLAKTSAKPGKTQLINHFIINDDWYLVDLPGYGWAKVSKKLKETWGPMITNYLQNRKHLVCIFVLIDSRLEPQKIDVDFIDFLGENGLPVALIFTKADKHSVNKSQKTQSDFNKILKQKWEEVPPSFITSSETGFGRDKVLSFIEELNSAWKTQNS